MYIIYSKDNCSYCIASKNLLSQKNIPFVEKKVGRDITKEMLLEFVPGATSVPQIFEDTEYVGGYTQLVERLSQTEEGSSQLLME